MERRRDLSKGGDSMIYENVKQLCDEKNMTIMALEKAAGLANGTVGRWRNSIPTAVSLQKVASVLEVSMESLMKEET